jgi:hypothetical protein
MLADSVGAIKCLSLASALILGDQLDPPLARHKAMPDMTTRAEAPVEPKVGISP